MKSKDSDINDLFAYCGLYCAACSVYIASQEDPESLQRIANRYNKTIEETRCNGCRSGKLSANCIDCDLKACAISKKINFCAECAEYPCSQLKEFQGKRPHRAELFTSLDYLKHNSVENWEALMKDTYSCPQCGKINSPYFMQCMQCKTFPGNKFIERNIQKIKTFLNIK